jgi:hypothetical protein
MQPEKSASALIDAFKALDRTGKAMFLMRIAHMQTIHARASYVVGGEGGDASALRRSNETLHRLCDHTLRKLTGDPDPDGDASFMAMILDSDICTPDQLWAWLRNAQIRTAGTSKHRRLQRDAPPRPHRHSP